MPQTIMLQGTASGVGKSTLTIGLCRILHKKGMRVAPFKVQNISDNTHTLPDGRRMARSQALAALACGITPHTDMNPILMAPSKQGGCEVIINGESRGEMGGYDSNQFRATLQNESMAAYRRLAADYDVIITEGAGSPVELNLRQNDYINMGFAAQIECPVILVTDIRRGGMFAMAYGTLELLHSQERALIKGLVVNNFYGDTTSFGEGKVILEDVTHTPVLGVLPHIDLRLEDEDDLADGTRQTRETIQENLPANTSFEEFQMEQIDLLADMLEQHLDIKSILQLLAQQ